MFDVAGLPLQLRKDRPLIMGVLNVTPDSFSDGGLWLDPKRAAEHGLDMRERGADIIDVGGESTRPGGSRVDAETELQRVIPVISALADAGVMVSVDTMRHDVAQRSLDAGAVLVNDVSGGLADPQMVPWLATVDAPYIVMHWRGHSKSMDDLATYGDVVVDVKTELSARVTAFTDAGVDPRRLILDPGLGFAKQSDHNWQLLHRLDELDDLGFPLLVGASRKRFLGSLLEHDGEPRPFLGRDTATDAVSALAAAHGVWGVRVHNVHGSLDSVLVGRAWAKGSER